MINDMKIHHVHCFFNFITRFQFLLFAIHKWQSIWYEQMIGRIFKPHKYHTESKRIDYLGVLQNMVGFNALWNHWNILLNMISQQNLQNFQISRYIKNKKKPYVRSSCVREDVWPVQESVCVLQQFPQPQGPPTAFQDLCLLYDCRI